MTEMRRERGSERLVLEKRPFMDSHGARAARQRHHTRVIAEVERLINYLHLTGAVEKPAPRGGPDRYIVQLGPVALSIAWLRGPLDGISDGTLLAIVWNGTILPRRNPETEKFQVLPTRTATSVWEDIISVEAESEATWRWCPQTESPLGFTSEELAARVVGKLEAAHKTAAAAA
jgi:hypothetical protein